VLTKGNYLGESTHIGARTAARTEPPAFKFLDAFVKARVKNFAANRATLVYFAAPSCWSRMIANELVRHKRELLQTKKPAIL
jgi:hypothetical protein